MKKLKSYATGLLTSTLFSLAVAGLVFPQHIFAQPLRISEMANLTADAHFQVEILEMSEDGGMPTRLSVEFEGRKFVLEQFENGYNWFDEGNPELSGFQAIPDLGKALRWDIAPNAEGYFQAAIPLPQLEPPSDVLAEVGVPRPGVRLVAPMAAAFEKPVEEQVVEALGFIDQANKRVELTALAPTNELVDMTISFAKLPAGSQLGADWGEESVVFGEEGHEKYIIVIAWGTLLALLGLAIVVCIFMSTYCLVACNIMCTWGVKRVEYAICGVGCGCNCFPPPPPDPPGCGGQTVTTTDVLEIGSGAPELALPDKAVTLSRFEEGDMVHDGSPVSYLMGEWALVSYTTGGKALGSSVEVLSTSSDAFAQAKAADLSTAVEVGAESLASGRHVALLLATPEHGDNSRAIHLPDVRLSEHQLAAAAGSGEILVRADYAEDRSLQDFAVLHDTLGGVSEELAGQVRDALSLEFHSDKQHRTVVFAVLSVDGGSLKLEEAVPYLPKCCCGEFFCV